MKAVLRNFARNLRINSTLAETLVWNKLRSRNIGLKFRRQAVIDRYIVDFVCFEIKLIIEIDGGQHADNNKDLIRDNWLKRQGFRILRFWNNEIIQNLEGVFEVIIQVINTPHLTSPTRGEE